MAKSKKLTHLLEKQHEIIQEIEKIQQIQEIQTFSQELSKQIEQGNILESAKALFSIYSYASLGKEQYEKFSPRVSGLCYREFSKPSFHLEQASCFAPFLECLEEKERNFCCKIIFNLLLSEFYSILNEEETASLKAIFSALAFVQSASNNYEKLEGFSLQFAKVVWESLWEAIQAQFQLMKDTVSMNSVEADKKLISLHQLVFLIRECSQFEVPSALEDCYLEAEMEWFKLSVVSSFSCQSFEEHGKYTTLVEDFSFISSRSLQRVCQLQNKNKTEEFIRFACEFIEHDLLIGHFQGKMLKLPLGTSCDLEFNRRTFMIHLNDLHRITQNLPLELHSHLKEKFEIEMQKYVEYFFNFCHREITTLISMDCIGKAQNFPFPPEMIEFHNCEFAPFFQQKFTQKIILECVEILEKEVFISLLLQSARLFCEIFCKWAFQRQKLQFTQSSVSFLEGESKRIRSFFLFHLPFSSGIGEIFDEPLGILSSLE